MAKYKLVLRTYTKTHHGRIVQCGVVTIENGEVLQKEENHSTLSGLSKALRGGGFIPGSVEIFKNKTVKFQYESREPPKSKLKKFERTVTASNFVAALVEMMEGNHRHSDREFCEFFRRNIRTVIYDGCEEDK